LYRHLKRICHVAFIIIIFLSACITAQQIPEAGDIHLIRNVPFFPQEEYQCGPSSLAGVLNYYEVPVSPEDIAKEIFSESARGTLTLDMVLFAQKRGLHVRQYTGDAEDLRKNIDRGYPLIMLVDYGFSLYQVNHFMVVVGYNAHGVIVNSGRNREKYLPWKDFLKTWEKTHFWTLLINKL
jgi:ABC-type bacteriocin/lantibiotic exporter with double-glycine peptidase domain